MKPIIFNTEMVRAILDGRKTQTRRPIKPQPDANGDISVPTNKNGMEFISVHAKGLSPYQIGDILYVRETWCYFAQSNPPWYGYRANVDKGYLFYRWKPSIHMPREAARIFLRVTNARAERVQEITETDSEAEGAYKAIWDVAAEVGDKIKQPTFKAGFSHIWNDIYTKKGYGWDINPWVWVYEFEKIERP